MKFTRFIDEHGLLDKVVGRDGGDTCQREGMFWFLLGILFHRDKTLVLKWLDRFNRNVLSYIDVLEKLHVAPGVFVRHSEEVSPDVNSWDRMSRDQFQSMIQATGEWSKRDLKKITMGHIIRGFLFTNNTRRNGANRKNHGKMVSGEVRNYDWKLPDITFFDIWGAFIRAWEAWYLWPLLIIFDLEQFFGSIKWRLFPGHNISMNHTLIVLGSMHRYPTPISWLSRKIMPVPRLIKLLGEHLRDFHPEDDMHFFEEMFTDTYKSLGGRI